MWLKKRAVIERTYLFLVNYPKYLFLAPIVKERLIGVTCTYGVNRAGYFICQYLVDQMEYEPDQAIRAFDTARGHSMDRQNYLKFIRTGVWERGY